MPKVSVIIPVYNVEKYLRECLDSVVNQTLQDIEIICVNDGSTDNSLEILKEYANKDNRIILIDKKNEGAGEARNKGLEKATGEYLAFLDGDDYYNINYLEKAYNKAITTNADVVVCSANSVNETSKVIKPMSWSLRLDLIPDKEIFNYKDFPNYIFNSFQNWNWNKLYKRTFIESNNIVFQKLYRTNDLYFTCVALVLANNISVLKENLVNYRIGMTKNSQSTNHLYPFDFYNAFKLLKQFLDKTGIYNEVESSYINWAISGCIYNCESIKDKKIRETLERKIIKNADKELGLYNLSEKNIYDEALLYKYNEMNNKYKFRPFRSLFSIRNSDDGGHKILTILGIKIKFRRRKKHA